jgi:hypothetical protein
MTKEELIRRIEDILGEFETKTNPINEETGAKIVCDEKTYCDSWDDAVNDLYTLISNKAEGKI